MVRFVLLAGLMAVCGAYSGSRGDASTINTNPNRGSSEYNQGKFRNGNAIADAYTAGGTSKPCTGKYCQDNPIGNPCPCPLWKPCRHDNDGHCMLRVDRDGKDVWDDAVPAEAVVHGTWTAIDSGNVGHAQKGSCDNLSKSACTDDNHAFGIGDEGPPQESVKHYYCKWDSAANKCVSKGHKQQIMCTAGSSDVYQSKEWPAKCDASNPKWCSLTPAPNQDQIANFNATTQNVRTLQGNACPARDCEFYWSAWSKCSQTCGGGRQSRDPLIVQQPKPAQPQCETDDGKACPAPKSCPVPQQRKCNVKACPPRRVPTPAPSSAQPTPEPYTPPACPDKKTKNRIEEAGNNKEQVKNMKEGLKASEDAQCARDECSERQNRVAETENLLEERMNKHILTCDGVDDCREMSMSSTHSYEM